jgi:hypothetical protein
MLVGKSLDAATATGPGIILWPDEPKNGFSLQVSYTDSVAIRANLAALTGGSSPTVTAWVAAA